MSDVATRVDETTKSTLGLVGKSIRRTDAREKITGQTRYAADFSMSDVLHCGLVRSPVPSARLTRRDVDAARAHPGVVAVLLGEDVPNNEVSIDVPGQQVEVDALRAKSQILATERVRYHGEPIALIVARTPEALAEARAMIDVEWEDLPAVYDPDAALESDAPLVHDAGNVAATWLIDNGDIDSAFDRADVIVEGEYSCHAVDHAYLEPEAGVAWFDDEGVLNIRSSTQVVEHYRGVAKILGIDQGLVRIHAPYLGGGFGGKEDMTVEPYLALATFRTGRPVKMVWSRGESLMARHKRHPARFRYRTAAMSDGTILGHDIEVTIDAGAYPLLSAYVLLYMSINLTGPYKSPNTRVRSRAVYTNNVPYSAFRGFGSMQAVLGYEGQIDLVADTLGLDPVQVRKDNALEKGYPIPAGQPFPTEVWLAECIDAALEAAGPVPTPSSDRVRVGRGLACNIGPYGRVVWLNDTSSAWIGFELDGSLVVRCSVPDVGGGQVASLAQIAGEVLGVDYERITVHFGDSARTPLAGTTTATRQLLMSGNATLLAATRLREQMLGGVAAALGLGEDDLELAGGGVITPEGVLPLQKAIGLCLGEKVSVHAIATYHGPRGKPIEGQQVSTDRIYPDATFGAHVADVEVDIETGSVRVVGYTACHDVGRAISPQRVEGQILGAVAQGLGYALSERIVVEDGINLTTGFFQYAIPTSADLPDLNCVILESGDGLGPFGARGIGEPPIGPCASAVARAVQDAIGVRPTKLPILAENVLDLLES